MKELGLKLCIFLFLATVFAGHTNALGTLTGAITGTILLSVVVVGSQFGSRASSS